MRKWFFGLLLTLGLLLCVSASAETYVFDSIYGTADIPDTYIVLTPDNLGGYEDWLQSRGTSAEQLSGDMAARGVLVQCWSADYSVCFELTAVQNETTQNIFDVNEQSTSLRGTYRLSHYPNNEYANYNFESADWKNTANGRFLIMRYKYVDNGVVDHQGYMRRTIRNGYEITFDLKVYGRKLTNKDNSDLNKIWDTFSFAQILPLPPAASAKIEISEAPPEETNADSFKFEGTAAQGVKFTAVVMGLNYPDPMLSEVEVGKSGKFKMTIKLPKEGVFMVTVTAEYQGEVVMELAYPVTYQHTLLTLNVSTEVPTQVKEDTLSILGTSTPGATIQIFVNDQGVGSKKVTAAGKFKVDIDTAQEGEYTVVLAFSKKGLSDRRLTYSFSRVWSDADMLKQIQAGAISPAYKTLVAKIDEYDGRTVGYKSYIVSTAQSGDEWIITMALSKKNGEYTSLFLVTSSSAPEFAADSRVMMYGRCAGMSVPDQEGGESYPCFELLIFTSI